MTAHLHNHDDYTYLNKETRSLLVLTLAATAQEVAIYEEYKHFVDTYDIDGVTITASRLMAWAQDPKREFYCIFCGSSPTEQHGFRWCCRCKEYKGVMPNCNP